VRSVADQLRTRSRGDIPAQPEPFAAVLAAEVDRLAGLHDVAFPEIPTGEL
jgi:hypothetical protein